MAHLKKYFTEKPFSVKDVGAAEDEAGQREGEQEHHAAGKRRQSNGEP